MTGQQRALCRAADRLPYHRGASERFDRLVPLRRSWGFWFVAAVAMGDTPGYAGHPTHQGRMTVASMVHVTAHAVSRALERIPGCKSEDEARAILSCRAVACAAKFAPAGSIYVRIASGNRIAVEDGHVVTVLPPHCDVRKLSSAAQCYRSWMRAWSIANWKRGKV